LTYINVFTKKIVYIIRSKIGSFEIFQKNLNQIFKFQEIKIKKMYPHYKYSASAWKLYKRKKLKNIKNNKSYCILVSHFCNTVYLNI